MPLPPLSQWPLPGPSGPRKKEPLAAFRKRQTPAQDSMSSRRHLDSPTGPMPRRGSARPGDSGQLLSTLVPSTAAARAPSSRQDAEPTEPKRATYDPDRGCAVESQTRPHGNCHHHHRRRQRQRQRQRFTFPYRYSGQSVSGGVAVDGRRLQPSGNVVHPALYSTHLSLPALEAGLANGVESRPPSDRTYAASLRCAAARSLQLPVPSWRPGFLKTVRGRHRRRCAAGKEDVVRRA